MDPTLQKRISPELRKRMQGKSCFNFTEIDPILFRELAALTRSASPLSVTENTSKPSRRVRASQEKSRVLYTDASICSPSIIFQFPVGLVALSFGIPDLLSQSVELRSPARPVACVALQQSLFFPRCLAKLSYLAQPP